MAEPVRSVEGSTESLSRVIAAILSTVIIGNSWTCSRRQCRRRPSGLCTWMFAILKRMQENPMSGAVCLNQGYCKMSGMIFTGLPDQYRKVTPIVYILHFSVTGVNHLRKVT